MHEGKGRDWKQKGEDSICYDKMELVMDHRGGFKNDCFVSHSPSYNEASLNHVALVYWFGEGVLATADHL